MRVKLLIHLYDGEATVLDGDSDARPLIAEYGKDWADWPQDLGCYDRGDGFLILEADYEEEDDGEFSNEIWTRMSEDQFRTLQAYGSIWFE